MYKNDIYTGESGERDNSGYNTYYTDYKEVRPVQWTKVEKEEKVKKGSFLHRATLCIILGLLFGLFAGIGFYVVQWTGEITDNRGESETTLIQNVEDNAVIDQEESKSGITLTDPGSVRVVSSDVSEVVDQVMPAMVSIISNYTQSGFSFFGQEFERESESSGSGIIVAESDTELLIVTNNHVVRDTTRLEVAFIDGEKAEAQVKGRDEEMDLAVIAIPLNALSRETMNAISIATMGDSDDLKLGEPVIAIGNALGYGQSVTNGIISALDRDISLGDGTSGTFIQTNAAINPGNSGGALLNISGEVIGINSVKIGSSVVEGMGYAIPISSAKPIISELMLKETRTRVTDGKVGYLGILGPYTVTEQATAWYNLPPGVFVTDLEEDGPAMQAGMLPGDILVSLEGERMMTSEGLIETLHYYSPGTVVEVTVKRLVDGDYKDIVLMVTLGERPER